jgi:pilus assembly protein CpaE
MSEFFLVHQEPIVCQAIKEAIASNRGFKLVGQAASSAELLSKIGSSNARVLLLQSRLSDTDALALIGQITAKKPGIYIVPILQGNETADIWQKILQYNLRDVLLPPFNAQNIAQVLTQSAQHSMSSTQAVSASAANSYVVAVAGARGGVGKTIFAVNLAIAMARQRVKTCLVDYSMNAGDFYTMLDQVPRNTIADAISQGGTLDVSLLTNLVAEHNLGFKFLACPNDDFDFYGFDLEQAKNLLIESRLLSEYVLVDTGAYDLPPTNAALQEADVIYLLTTRDLSRLMALHRWIKNLETDINPEKIKVIVNNAEIGDELKEHEIEEILQHPITAYLPTCAAETTYSINSGKPLITALPDHPFSIVINKLAEYTIARWATSGG